MTADLDRIYREHVAGLTARLLRRFGAARLDVVEAAIHDAFLSALAAWPARGVPDSPAAWLLAVARNAALDRLRRERFEAAPREPLGEDGGDGGEPAAPGAPRDPRLAGELADDELAMMFVACHPALPRESQVAIALRTLAGLPTAASSRALFAEEAAIEKRRVRARRELRDRRIAIEVPPPHELGERLDAVLTVMYALFSEGYAAHHGARAVRRELCDEAIRMTGVVAAHPATDRPRVHALLALMLLHAARLDARVDASGALVSLEHQDRARWDRALVGRAFAHLARSAAGDEASPYHYEAGIAACHVVAPSFAETDWDRIVGFYDRLIALDASPVARLNRAIAVAHARGAEAGLRELRHLARDPVVAGSWLYDAALADLQARAGVTDRARAAYARAIAQAGTDDERRFLERRLAELA
jgi:RNA polymerase sigma-70 factor (ECF subfamily)